LCIKAGNNELDSVKAIMTMSLRAVIADIFDCNLDEIRPDMHMFTDPEMDAHKQLELEEMLADSFGGLQVDFTRIELLEDLFEQVVESAFEDTPDCALST